VLDLTKQKAMQFKHVAALGPKVKKKKILESQIAAKGTM